MDMFICERGIALKVDEFIASFGNEELLKLKKRLTITSIDKMTKVPRKTAMYTIVKTKVGSILEIPRFCMSLLESKNYIKSITSELSVGERINCEYLGQSNPNQQVVVQHVLNIFRNKNKHYHGATLKLMAGCHALNTKILMFDGTIKHVQDIEVGEQLMGDDSTPREVLNLVRGNNMMYQITNVKGESYIVNSDHILCLIYTNKKRLYFDNLKKCYVVIWFNNKTISVKTKFFTITNKTESEVRTMAQSYYNNIIEDRIIEICVSDYLLLPKRLKQNLKGYKAKVEFLNIDTPIDPYMIGYWLGDGHTSIPAITSQESSVLKYFTTGLAQYNCYLQYQNGYTYRINGTGTRAIGSNAFQNGLVSLNLINNKHIPYIYLCNSRANRLKLLAGLIDADGNLDQRTKSQFEFSQSIAHSQIIDDIIYLCHSLGFACYKNKKKTSWIHNGIKKYGDAWRICINGEGIEQIPTLSPRKQATPRQQIKNVLVSGITITPLKVDNYYGFQVDKNQRYLMGNFIVTHNCGKSFVAMDLIGKIKRKTLIVVPNTYLLDQWVKLLEQYFPTSTIGVLYGDKKRDGDIIVGIINTIAELQEYEVKEKLPLPNIGKTLKHTKRITSVSVNDILSKIGLTVFDESQMYVSPTFRKVFKRIHSRFTIGLSATPDIREDKLDRIHTSWLGPIIDADTLENYSASQDAFQSKATLVKYYAHDDHTSYTVRDDGVMDYQSILETLVNDPNRNKLIVDNIIQLANKGHYVFVFSDRRTHLEHLYDLVCEHSFDAPVNLSLPEADKKIILYGGSSEATIQTANNISNIVFTTYQYSSTGVSIKKMDCLIQTTPRRSNMKQIINRVFRLGSDQSIERQLIDIVDMKMPIKNQYKERIKAYNERGSTIISVDHVV